MQQKEITLGRATLTLNVKDGEVHEGNLYAKGIELSNDGEPVVIELPEQIKWSNDNQVESAVKDALEVDERWPDTSDPGWDSHWLIKPDTQIFEVAKYVYYHPFCTSSDIDDELDLDDNLQNVVYTCKNKNLIKTVGRDGSSHILAPTHLTFKEMLIYEERMKKNGETEASEYTITTDDNGTR